MSLKRSALSRGKPLKKRGERSLKWENFRNLKAARDCDEEGLIKCQDKSIGLPACGISIPSPDLHHIEGRDGKLLFDESKMVWLTRECHNEAHHRNNSSSSRQTKDD